MKIDSIAEQGHAIFSRSVLLKAEIKFVKEFMAVHFLTITYKHKIK